MPANQRMKLTGDPILVSQGMKVLQATPAAYPYRSAAEGFRVTTADALIAVIGSPVNSEAVRALIAADGLVASDEPEGWSVPRRSYLSGLAAGYTLTHALGRVVTATLYAEPAEGFAAFSGPLPGELPRGASRPAVRTRFGRPERSGEGRTITGLEPQGAWDRFEVDGVLIHFQYAVVGHVVWLVSVMSPDAAP